MNKSTRYSPEVRERAIRLVFEHQGGARLAVGGAQFNSEQDCLHTGDLAQVGASRRVRPRLAGRDDELRPRAAQSVAT